MVKKCAICRATFIPNKRATSTETRHLCMKCRKQVRARKELGYDMDK